MYEFTCYHCVLYAITPLISLLSSSPSAAHPPGQRHPCAPRRHCSTSKHRRMIACGGLRRRLRRAVFGSASGGHLRRAILHLRRHLRRAVLDGACGWRSPAAPAAGRLRQRLRRAGEPTYRTAAAGEPTYRTAAGGAFGGRVRWRRRDSLPAVAAAAGGRGLGEAGARAWRGGRAAAAVGLSGVVSTVGRRAR